MRHIAFLSLILFAFASTYGQGEVVELLETERLSQSFKVSFQVNPQVDAVEQVQLKFELNSGETITPAKTALVGQSHFLPPGSYVLEWFPGWESRSMPEQEEVVTILDLSFFDKASGLTLRSDASDSVAKSEPSEKLAAEPTISQELLTASETPLPVAMEISENEISLEEQVTLVEEEGEMSTPEPLHSEIDLIKQKKEPINESVKKVLKSDELSENYRKGEEIDKSNASISKKSVKESGVKNWLSKMKRKKKSDVMSIPELGEEEELPKLESKKTVKSVYGIYSTKFQ